MLLGLYAWLLLCVCVGAAGPGCSIAAVYVGAARCVDAWYCVL